MAEVRFVSNEWVREDQAFAQRLETALAGLVAQLEPKGRIDARILIGTGSERSVRFQLERPGWFSDFTVPLRTVFATLSQDVERVFARARAGEVASRANTAAPAPPLDLL